jgi:hypothetical protein
LLKGRRDVQFPIDAEKCVRGAFDVARLAGNFNASVEGDVGLANGFLGFTERSVRIAAIT